MALFTNNVKTQNEQSQEPQFDLELTELEMLLKILGNADIKGNQVEVFYKMVIKLQNHYNICCLYIRNFLNLFSISIKEKFFHHHNLKNSTYLSLLY